MNKYKLYVTLITIATICISTKLFSQNQDQQFRYRQIIKYLDSDIGLVSHSSKLKKTVCGCVYPYLIKTNFVSVIGLNLQELKTINSDSLTKALEDMDAQANEKYERQHFNYLVTKKVKCSYIISFSRPWNNIMYVEMIPYNPQKKTSFDLIEYMATYMGKINSYMFKFAGNKIVDVKRGVYYAQ